MQLDLPATCNQRETSIRGNPKRVGYRGQRCLGARQGKKGQVQLHLLAAAAGRGWRHASSVFITSWQGHRSCPSCMLLSPSVPSCLPSMTPEERLFSEAALPGDASCGSSGTSSSSPPTSQTTPFQKGGLLLWLARCQLGPAGKQMSLSYENQRNPERRSLNREGRKSECGLLS